MPNTRIITYFYLLMLCPLMGLVQGYAQEEGETLAMRQLRRLVEEENRILNRWHGDGPPINEEEMGQLFQRLIYRYDRFVRENPEHVPGLVAYGLLLDRLGYHDEAVPLFLEANALDSQIAVVKNQLGNYQRAEGDVISALGYYLAANELEPDEPLYHFQIGQVLLHYREELIEQKVITEDSYDERLLEALTQAMQLHPEEMQYAYHLGLAFYALDKPRWEDALTHWREVEKSTESNLEKQTIRLHQARVLIELGEFAGAEQMLSSVDHPTLRQPKAELEESLQKVSSQSSNEELSH